MQKACKLYIYRYIYNEGSTEVNHWFREFTEVYLNHNVNDILSCLKLPRDLFTNVNFVKNECENLVITFNCFVNDWRDKEMGRIFHS